MASIPIKQLSTAEYESKIKSLEQELNIAKSANVEIQNVNDSLAQRVQAIEQESRTEKIANIVSGAYPQDADEKINYFVQSGLSIDQISKIVAPLKSSSRIKAASYNSQVAIRNESVSNGKKDNAWAESYLGLLNGGNQ